MCYYGIWINGIYFYSLSVIFISKMVWRGFKRAEAKCLVLERISPPCISWLLFQYKWNNRNKEHNQEQEEHQFLFYFSASNIYVINLTANPGHTYIHTYIHARILSSFDLFSKKHWASKWNLIVSWFFF